MTSPARFVAIVLARMDSRRLPGKAMSLINGLPLIHYVLQRAFNIPGVDRVVLATTTRAIDDVLVDYAASQGASTYRGSADDVAGRMLDAAVEYDATFLMRINGDSLFIDPSLIAAGIARCDHTTDLVTNLARDRAGRTPDRASWHRRHHRRGSR